MLFGVGFLDVLPRKIFEEVFFGRVGWKGKLGTGEEGEVFLRATGEGFSGSFLRRLQTGKLEGR